MVFLYMVHGLRYTVKSAVPGNVVFSGSAGGRVGVCFCACEDIEVFRLRDNLFYEAGHFHSSYNLWGRWCERCVHFSKEKRETSMLSVS